MLTYLGFHFRYTLPIIGLLLLILRPIINRAEIFKIVFISAIALVYTTPWDNYMIYNGAWWFSTDRILATVGYVPVEEYMFFIIQTVLSSLWTLLCVRWSTPCSNFNHDRRSYELIRWVPIFLFGIITVIGYVIAVPGQRTFYIGCVFWWVSPVIMFLWYGAGNFFIKKIKPSSIAILVPTLYLSWIDQIALKEKVWLVDEKITFQISVAEDLPFEEAFFFLISNLMVVLSTFAFDKSCAMIETYTLEFPLRFSMSWEFICQVFWAFATPEYAMPSIVTEDINRCIEVLNKTSKSFITASHLVSAGIRLDLIILYTFYHVTKDTIDNEPDVQRKKRKLELIKSFIDELFVDRKSDHEIMKKPQQAKIDWVKYESELTDIEMSCFRAISRTAFYFPRKPFYELLAGYQWDVERKTIQSEKDLLAYSNISGGSIGALSVFVMMYKCDNDKYEYVEKYDHVVEKGQLMGRVLKLVDITRNIVTDSESFGCCYIPSEYMDDAEEEERILCIDKNPRSLGDKKLKKYSMRMVQLVNKDQLELVNAFKDWPHETRGLAKAVFEIYRRITSAIHTNHSYPTRTSLSKYYEILIVLYSIYFKSK